MQGLRLQGKNELLLELVQWLQRVIENLASTLAELNEIKLIEEKG